MKNLSTSTSNSTLLSNIRQAISRFNKTEWRIFFGLLVVLIVSTIGILHKINQSFLTEVPIDGGSIQEGIVGTPRFINPVLASTDADKDMVSIIYGGLMRKDTNGAIIPDLAEKVDISKDNLKYTFTLKDGVTFHDNTPVTADDVVFTIQTIKDSTVKSPLKSNWDGVTVEKIDARTVTFTLKQPYSSFLENTTVGVLPASLWNDSPIELNNLNINPIGTGPYKITKTKEDDDGSIQSYKLSAFKKFSLGKPHIKDITIHFYQNEDDLVQALTDGAIDQISSISPENAKILAEKGYKIKYSVLPRIFGLFFNQNQNQIFTDKNVVTAINLAINKDNVVKQVLSGYGVVIDGPIPPNMIEYQTLDKNTSSTYEENVVKAAAILAKDGWTKSTDGVLEKTVTENKKKITRTLEFSISTGNAPELTTSANLIKSDLEKLGIRVDVKTFDIGNLNQIVIRPRKYDALLFGQIINHESDLFAFWHSTQRKDPGLNVALYTNSKVDKILEDAFVTVDEANRIKKYAQFEQEIKKDMPAVFLYSPDFIYVTSKKIRNLSIDHIVSPADRFLALYTWYTMTDKVWNIFVK
jgi:peptide/nickel transport system substrate-binding protein